MFKEKPVKTELVLTPGLVDADPPAWLLGSKYWVGLKCPELNHHHGTRRRAHALVSCPKAVLLGGVPLQQGKVISKSILWSVAPSSPGELQSLF